MSAQRLTTWALLTSTSLSRPARVSSIRITSAMARPNKARTTAVAVISSMARPNDVRVTAYELFQAQSVHRQILFNRLDGGQIWGIEEFESAYVNALVPEFNPYRPTIPNEFMDIGDEFYYFTRENQEIIRQQHNLSQAGDTTFPWQMLTECHTEKFVNLGAIGRFYHEAYGVIRARYVKFDQMNQTLNINAPVGLMNSHPTLDWVVTNRLNYSNPFLVVGVIPAYAMPKDGQYGWAVIEGVIPAEVFISGQTNQIIGQPFVWGESGFVTQEGAGRIIGRRVGNQSTSRLAPGCLKIEFESFGLDQVQVFIDGLSASITGTLNSLDHRLDLLEAANQSSGNSVASLTQQIALVKKALELETQRRINADNAIKQMINNFDGVSESDLASAVLALQNAINLIESNLGTSISLALGKANEALALIAQIPSVDLTSVKNSITWIISRLDALEAQPVVTLPLVDGSVPPNLMYLDDGSLIWVEIP